MVKQTNTVGRNTFLFGTKKTTTILTPRPRCYQVTRIWTTRDESNSSRLPNATTCILSTLRRGSTRLRISQDEEPSTGTSLRTATPPQQRFQTLNPARDVIQRVQRAQLHALPRRIRADMQWWQNNFRQQVRTERRAWRTVHSDRSAHRERLWLYARWFIPGVRERFDECSEVARRRHFAWRHISSLRQTETVIWEDGPTTTRWIWTSVTVDLPMFRIASCKTSSTECSKAVSNPKLECATIELESCPDSDLNTILCFWPPDCQIRLLHSAPKWSINFWQNLLTRAGWSSTFAESHTQNTTSLVSLSLSFSLLVLTLYQ